MTHSRWASVNAGASATPVARATSSNSRWNVWIDTPSTPVCLAARLAQLSLEAVGVVAASARRASDRGPSPPASPARISPALPELGGPTISESDIQPSIGRPTEVDLTPSREYGRAHGAARSQGCALGPRGLGWESM